MDADLKDNPLLVDSGLPDFARIEPGHVVPAVKRVVADALAKLELLEKSVRPSWDGVMTPLEEIERPFEYAWKPVGHLLGVKNSPELRTAHEEAMPLVINYSLRIRQSEPIFKALQQIRRGPDWGRLTGTQQRIIEDRIKDAELAGIALSGDGRRRFNEIEQELSQLTTEFANHVLDATKAHSLDITNPQDAEGFPETLRQLAAQAWNNAHPEAESKATPEKGPWRITLEIPLYSPFMEHCRNASLREGMYRAFVTRASTEPFDNGPLIPKILKLRLERAKLLGKKSFAEVSLARKMAPSVAAIREMSEQLRQAAAEPAKQDLQDLRDLKAKMGDAGELQLWDVPFYAERVREKRYAYTDEEIRPYFPFERVLQGLFDLLARIFDIRVEQVKEGVSVWNPDVRFYNVHDESGTHIASFYLDPFSRPSNKRGGAWMDDCLGRRRIGNRQQLPVAHLVCNQTPPVGDRPALMTFREVETLFHEFGHGLQHMLTRIDHPDAAGINGVEWDAVELPSQFMENWCYHRPVLMGMTRHFETGAPLPEELYQKIVAARNFRSGSQMLRQLLFGLTDLELHEEFDPNGPESASDVQRRLSVNLSPLPLLPEDRSLCSFQHIFSGGYAAGYYSYKWAEVLSADAFSAFEEAGLDNEAAVKETGRRFRETVLALGGSQHPLEVFRAFRGREPQVEPLLRHMGLLAK